MRPVCRESLVIVYRLRCRVKTFFFFRFCAITCGIYLCIYRIFRASLVSIFVSIATLKYSIRSCNCTLQLLVQYKMFIPLNWNLPATPNASEICRTIRKIKNAGDHWARKWWVWDLNIVIYREWSTSVGLIHVSLFYSLESFKAG